MWLVVGAFIVWLAAVMVIGWWGSWSIDKASRRAARERIRARRRQR